MVTPRTPIEQLLGVRAPSGPPSLPGEMPIAPPEVPGGGTGLSVEAARLLTGDASPAAPAGEIQVGNPSSPMSDPVPPQNPSVASTPSGGAGLAAGAAPASSDINVNDPKDPSNGDIVKDFWARHGRAPTPTDIQMIHAIPVLEQQLGRPPMRIEVLQMLGARQETPEAPLLQFEPDVPTGANPVTVTMGQAPGQEPITPPPPPTGGNY